LERFAVSGSQKDADMQIQSDGDHAASTFSLPPHAQMSGYSLPVTHTDWLDVGTLDDEAEFPLDAVVNHNDLGRGLRWALAIELAAALSVYAIWHLCHLLF
jgi:hypothetical protein